MRIDKIIQESRELLLVSTDLQVKMYRFIPIEIAKNESQCTYDG